MFDDFFYATFLLWDISQNSFETLSDCLCCYNVSNGTNLDSWEAEALLQFENYVNFDEEDHQGIPAVKIKTSG